MHKVVSFFPWSIFLLHTRPGIWYLTLKIPCHSKLLLPNIFCFPAGRGSFPGVYFIFWMGLVKLSGWVDLFTQTYHFYKMGGMVQWDQYQGRKKKIKLFLTVDWLWVTQQPFLESMLNPFFFSNLALHKGHAQKIH